MKVAIIGAGVSGLAAGITLEKNGVNPDIYEQNAFISDHYSHVGVALNMAYRSITTEPLKFLNDLLGIELEPLESIKKLIIYSKNSKAVIDNEDIGFSFIMGQEPTSVTNQLLKHIKKSNMLYEKRVTIDLLKEKYDYVIAANGSRSEDYVADKYLKNWKQYLVAYTRVAKLHGDFETNAALIWGNKEVLKKGYAFLAPFNSRTASLYVTIPYLKGWEELNTCWKDFLQQTRILDKATLLGTYDRTHVSANSMSVRWENCFFVGDQGGFLEPFIGLGAATAIASGVLAAKAIIGNEDYDQLTQQYKKVILTMSEVRNFYDSIDDEMFDTIVAAEDNPLLKKLIYGTDIDWLKYGAIAVSPFVKSQKSRNFHETASSPTH